MVSEKQVMADAPERIRVAQLEPAKPGPAAEPVAWLHEIDEPGGIKNTILSRSENNPWTHWLEKYQSQCEYKVTPLYTRPPESRLREARLREAAREAVNCITHYAEDNENTRWVLSLLNAALKEASDERA